MLVGKCGWQAWGLARRDSDGIARKIVECYTVDDGSALVVIGASTTDESRLDVEGESGEKEFHGDTIDVRNILGGDGNSIASRGAGLTLERYGKCSTTVGSDF